MRGGRGERFGQVAHFLCARWRISRSPVEGLLPRSSLLPPPCAPEELSEGFRPCVVANNLPVFCLPLSTREEREAPPGDLLLRLLIDGRLWRKAAGGAILGVFSG